MNLVNLSEKKCVIHIKNGYKSSLGGVLLKLDIKFIIVMKVIYVTMDTCT